VPLSARDVAEIARLLEESDFEELHIEQDGLKLTLRRGSAPRQESGGSARAPGTTPLPAGAAGPAGAGREARGEAAACAADGSLLNVIAPFVGIFYRAPRPGAPPYIEVGSEVQEDTIVGIIEVMKLMNAVRAEVRGTVAEILVADGAVVEYGQVLARVARAVQHG
jgi:acetyl-CoA carboxylase biotin carboxyl carrier protein